MSALTRERLQTLKLNGPGCESTVDDDEWQIMCDMALRSLADASATRTTTNLPLSEWVKHTGVPYMENWKWQELIRLAHDAVYASPEERRKYVFERWRGSQMMAEGITVHATSLDDAVERAWALAGDKADTESISIRLVRPCMNRVDHK